VTQNAPQTRLQAGTFPSRINHRAPCGILPAEPIFIRQNPIGTAFKQLICLDNLPRHGAHGNPRKA